MSTTCSIAEQRVLMLIGLGMLQLDLVELYEPARTVQNRIERMVMEGSELAREEYRSLSRHSGRCGVHSCEL